jgi:hypothetical protein
MGSFLIVGCVAKAGPSASHSECYGLAVSFSTAGRGDCQGKGASGSVTPRSTIQTGKLYAGVRAKGHGIDDENSIGAVGNAANAQLDIATESVERGHETDLDYPCQKALRYW